MRSTSLKLLTAMLLGGSLFATGCKSSNPPAAQNTAQTTPASSTPAQGVRNPDGSITNPDGSVTYPPGTGPAAQSAQNGATSAPPASANSMQNQPPQHVALVVPSGTAVTVRLNGGLAASRNNVGDRWTGTLERPLRSHDEVVFPRGTPVSGDVVAAKGRGRFKGAGDLAIQLTAIGRDRVSSTEYEAVSKGRGKRTAGFAGGGAGLGAIVGGLAGGGKGALIGGLAGAGAGTAAGAYTGNRDVLIPSESVITFRLTDSLRH